jgi:hypothetical protein
MKPVSHKTGWGPNRKSHLASSVPTYNISFHRLLRIFTYKFFNLGKHKNAKYSFYLILQALFGVLTIKIIGRAVNILLQMLRLERATSQALRAACLTQLL